MSQQSDSLVSAPSSLQLTSADLERAAAAGGIRLIVAGQGAVLVTLRHRQTFEVCFADTESWGAPAVRWRIDRADVTIDFFDCEWRELARTDRRQAGFGGRFPSLETVGTDGSSGEMVPSLDADLGLDLDPTCTYWFSFDHNNRQILYGKGELRLSAALVKYVFPTQGERGSSTWMRGVRTVTITPTGIMKTVEVTRDPVCVDPPLKVISPDVITMEQMARRTHTVPANLSPECRVLHDNVAGGNFRLDDDDFPEFSRAITASIAAKDGWCRNKLLAKADEFGAHDITTTYLRITLGLNQGESPGIPFVMEIWPPGHRSPIHNHGGAHAVIKVLHGSIRVFLYRMLSDRVTEPFMTETFTAGEITWLTPRLNQNHLLQNPLPPGLSVSKDLTIVGEPHDPSDATVPPPCVTIQCYVYSQGSDQHYPYFDYIQQGGQPFGHFEPNSDMDFLAFKAKMREEWQRNAAK